MIKSTFAVGIGDCVGIQSLYQPITLYLGQWVSHRVRQASPAIPDAPEFVLVQLARLIDVRVDRAATEGQFYFAELPPPGIIVKIRPHLDDVITYEVHRLVIILEPVVLAYFVPHAGNCVEVVGYEVGFLVLNRLKYAVASVHGCPSKR